jgi:hypothetical protein
VRNFVIIIVGVIIVSSLFNLGSGTGVVSTVFANTPWWIYFVLAGIIYSGYRASIHFAEEKKVDETFIEEEGKKYIERMHNERERRKITRDS